MAAQEEYAGMITSELLQDAMKAAEGHQSGSLGPVSWQADYFFDRADLPSSYAKVKLQVFGKSLVDAALDLQNPKVAAEKKVLGFDVAVELGLEIDSYSVYYQVTVSGFTYRHTILYFPVY